MNNDRRCFPGSFLARRFSWPGKQIALFGILLWLLGSATIANGQVPPVVVRAEKTTAWVGQRIPFFVELRANGSFAGTASFDIPQISGSLILKIGNPVVSSKEIEGETWFVQTHEFAIFSQRAGKLTLPETTVRFAHRQGFTGEAQDQNEQVPSIEFEIERPPGTEHLGFLVTTESLEVKESWDPTPGPAKVGDIFKRTITQTATELSGMALAPASTRVPEGIRVYSNDAQTQDQSDRGSFIGTRTETITYLLTQPGTETLPALKYTWWNPDQKKLQSTTLPSVEFGVAAAPPKPGSEQAAGTDTRWSIWGPVLIGLALLAGVVYGLRTRIGVAFQQLVIWLNPPDRAAARSLVRAARKNELHSAIGAWNQWRNTQPAQYRPGDRLESAVLEMEDHIFGRHPTPDQWQGQELVAAFREEQSRPRESKLETEQVLPRLNP